MTMAAKRSDTPALFQYQTTNHHGSFINYGPPTRDAAWCNWKRDTSNGTENRHYRFVRVN